jgi:peptidoglycan lytic transglycosylase
MRRLVPRSPKQIPWWILFFALAALFIIGFFSLPPLLHERPQIVRHQAEPLATAKVHSEIGRASWYDLKGKTASGEMMNPNGFTAAHRSLPLGTEVLVENMENGQTAHVRVNDRGPYAKGRILDLSREAADELGIVRKGEATVRIQPLKLPSQR